MAGEPEESLIGWLASLIKSLGIKMRTDKCTAPQFLDLPPKSRARQVPVVIECRMLRVQFDTEPGRIILSRGRRGGDSGLCAECNGVVIDARTWTHLRSASVKKRSQTRVCRPRRIRCHQDWPLQCDPGNRRSSRDHL